MIFISLACLCHSGLLEDVASVPGIVTGKKGLGPMRSPTPYLGHGDRFHLKLTLLVTQPISAENRLWQN